MIRKKHESLSFADSQPLEKKIINDGSFFQISCNELCSFTNCSGRFLTEKKVL